MLASSGAFPRSTHHCLSFILCSDNGEFSATHNPTVTDSKFADILGAKAPRESRILSCLRTSNYLLGLLISTLKKAVSTKKYLAPALAAATLSGG
jgi:hypothetical protein